MNIPEKIKIGGHEYTVKIVPPKDMGHSTQTGRFREAFTDILIVDDVGESQQAATLLHELIDGIMNLVLEAQVPHSTICAVSEMLFQVLRDNDLDFRKGGDEKCC